MDIKPAKSVVGYKKTGVLAANDPDYIDAIIIGHCPYANVTRTMVVRLGREWRGKGYMSEAHSLDAYLDDRCFFPQPGRDPNAAWDKSTIQVFFSVNGKFDINNGENYAYVTDSTSVVEFRTREISEEIVPKAWDFILGKM